MARPRKSANKANQNLRAHKFPAMRVSEGFLHIVALLKKEQGDSAATIIHDAVQQYAYKKLQDPAGKNWIDKI